MENDGPLTVVFQIDNPGDDPKENHWHQYDRGRELFLESRSDAMLIIESDIVPPPDTIPRLQKLNVDVAYGTYAFRVDPRAVNVFERYPAPARNQGSSLSLSPGKWAQAKKAGVVDCSGGGWGCILVRRPVMEAIEIPRPEGVFCDTWWTRKVYQAGYTMKADIGLRCGHIDEDGRTLWPY